jgi:DNA repair exonuclease SbcCD ATPase subunit
MKCLAFTNTCEDDHVDESDPAALRLKCGHAFHASCILQAFRSGISCPTCGSTLRNLNDILQEAVDAVQESDQQWLAADLLREQVRRTNPEVKRVRNYLNKSRKKYNILVQDLVSSRSRIVKSALLDFRKTRKADHSNQVQHLQRSLDIVREAETKAMIEPGDISEDSVKAFMEQYGENDYRVECVFEAPDMNQPDPLDRSFWLR